MIEDLENYANALNANAEVLSWLRTTGKKQATKAFTSLTYTKCVEEIEHILDFFVSGAAPARLQRMSYLDAKRKAKEWSDANQKKGRNLIDTVADLETIFDFGNGKKIVRLKTKTALQREGFLMGHCVGGYDPNSADCLIYSYRDEKNNPHATFEVRKNSDEIVQIKGKGNGPIHPKYIEPILTFLKQIGMDIRPHDMANLGYHHIQPEQLEFLKNYPTAIKQIAEIRGESYAFG